MPWSGSFASSGDGLSQGRSVKLGVSQSNVAMLVNLLTCRAVCGVVWCAVSDAVLLSSWPQPQHFQSATGRGDLRD